MPVAAPELCVPAFQSAPKSDDTLGPMVADLCEQIGYAPDPEQRLALDLIFAERKGHPAAFETGIVCSRQNLKTAVFKMAALGWLFLLDQRLVVWSAHEFRTAQEAFGDLQALIGGAEFLAKRVKRIRTGAGSEAIELKSGARLIFKARTTGGGRGLTGNKVILDEAFALRPYHMGALLPTLSAVPDPQVLYGSSAGHADSDVLRRIRDRGRDGDRSLNYLEWCDPTPQSCQRPDCDHELTREGCALDDESRWARSNPALGRRITIEHIRNERRALPPGEFARERLGWWDEPGGEPLINLSVWADCADEAAPYPDSPVLAVDMPIDRASASIGAAAVLPDGTVHLELVARQRGTDWILPKLLDVAARLNTPVAIDKGSGAASLIPELEKAGIRVVPMDTRDLARACGAMYDLIHQRKVVHRGQLDLDEAVAGVQKRPLGEAWAWGRKTSTADISPLVAVTLAAWGAGVNGPSIYEERGVLLL